MWYFYVYTVGKTQEKIVTTARYVLFSGVKCRQNVKKIAPAAQNILFPSVSYRYHIISRLYSLLLFFPPSLTWSGPKDMKRQLKTKFCAAGAKILGEERR